MFWAFFGIGNSAYAANLYFSPSSGSHAVGSTFSTVVYVSTADQAMNAASGEISFSSDKLEVTSLLKTGSIFSLWVQEPTFSNSFGKVNFEGIALNPGFKGSNGKLLVVNFRVKAAGVAALNFSSGSVLANDGKGTNILSSLGSGSFNLIVPAADQPLEPETPQKMILSVPLKLVVSSSTHPDPNKWYPNNDPKFEWPLPDNISGVNVLADRNPDSDPGTISDGIFNSYDYEDVKNGEWYFHIKLRNGAGWGGVSHYRFLIDDQKPASFDIEEIKKDDLTVPNAKFRFSAADEVSGIDHYEIWIDGANHQDWQDDGSHVFETPALDPGKHMLIAKVFDKAGNFLVNFAEFSTEALKAPIIEEYTEKIAGGEILIARGTTYPNVQVAAWLQKEQDEPKKHIIQSDDKGNFIFSLEEKLKDGVYKLWFEVIDGRSAKSVPTDKLTIIVEKSAICRIGTWSVDIISLVIPLIVFIVLLLAAGLFVRRRYLAFKKIILKEVDEAEKILHQSFIALREEIEEQVAKLDGFSALSDREKNVRDDLKNALEISEKFIKKEINDIGQKANKRKKK